MAFRGAYRFKIVRISVEFVLLVVLSCWETDGKAEADCPFYAGYGVPKMSTEVKREPPAACT